MGGGLMQLVAYGAQDIYLTGNPQITFFKVVYRRYTNFAMELIQQTFNGMVGCGNKVTATVSRNGDLVHDCFIEMCGVVVNSSQFTNKSCNQPSLSYTEDCSGCNASMPGTVGGDPAFDNASNTRGGNKPDPYGIANLGTALLTSVEVEIGGQQIDKHWGHWMETWTQLSQPNCAPKNTVYDEVLTAVSEDYLDMDDGSQSNSAKHINANTVPLTPNNFQRMSLSGGVCVKNYGQNYKLCASKIPDPQDNQPQHYFNDGCSSGNCNVLAFPSNEIRVPLQFWFCKNPGLSLPLIALQYHEVDIKVQFASNSSLNCAINRNFSAKPGTNGVKPQIVDATGLNAYLWCNYIYLDTDERRRFAQVSHEYLIEQLQFQCETKNSKFRLNFNHPVKEIVWIGTPNAAPPCGGAGVSSSCGSCSTGCGGCNTWCGCDMGPSTPSPIVADNKTTFVLSLNGQERFAPQPITYFTQWQVNQYHTGEGSRGFNQGWGLPHPNIAVYSFALQPEEHQPSGSCNFSRIDTAELSTSCGAQTVCGINIYAVNYNVLRIMSGMGGLAYSN